MPTAQMQLSAFRVTNFRSVRDSGWIDASGHQWHAYVRPRVQLASGGVTHDWVLELAGLNGQLRFHATDGSAQWPENLLGEPGQNAAYRGMLPLLCGFPATPFPGRGSVGFNDWAGVSDERVIRVTVHAAGMRPVVRDFALRELAAGVTKRE